MHHWHIIRWPTGESPHEEEENEGEDPSLEIFQKQMLDRWESGGESGNGE
jgi:hypothetical protein